MEPAGKGKAGMRIGELRMKAKKPEVGIPLAGKKADRARSAQRAGKDTVYSGTLKVTCG